MDVSRSLQIAAIRSDNPDELERAVKGIDVQVWGTVLGLLACVVGPLVLNGAICFEAFAAVVASGLGIVGAAIIQFQRRRGGDVMLNGKTMLRLAPMMLCGGAVVAPTMALRTSASGEVQAALLIFFLAGTIIWFIAECSKLRLLEELASSLPGRDLERRAQRVRWGAYVALLTLSAGLMLALADARDNGEMVPRIQGGLVLSSAVGLITLTLLTVLLYSRTARALCQQAQFARVVRDSAGISAFHSLEPDWMAERPGVLGV